MIIYIAGPMSGYPDYNHPAFFEAQKVLEAKGHIVVNPAVLPVGLDNESYMPICIAMVNSCNAIYALDGYMRSEGAMAEVYFGLRQGMNVYTSLDDIPALHHQ